METQALEPKRRRGRKKQLDESNVDPICTVIPPSNLMCEPVDFDSGGKFLKQIDRFIVQYHAGTEVLGRF